MEKTALLAALNAAQALITFIVNRGISRNRVQSLLDNAASLGVDITDDVVQTELDATKAELDATQALIDRE